MTKMSEKNKKETVEKAVENPENNEVVAKTPIVEEAPLTEEVESVKAPKKKIK